MKRKGIFTKGRILGLVLSLLALMCAPIIHYSRTEVAEATIAAKTPVTSRDVIYQIITDRFYDGDTGNNIPAGFDSRLYDGTGNDLKLFQGGDWQGIIDKIPYLKNMGITAVWISAPYENRDEAITDYKSGGGYDTWTSFHGYHVRNYFASNKHFGTLNEFKELRDALHENDMKLIIDFVTNHTSRWQNPTNNFTPEDGRLYEPDKLPSGEYALNANGEPYDYNNDGLVENLLADPNNDVNGWFHALSDRGGDSSRFGYRYKDLGSLADFSQENGTVAAYLEKAVKYWAGLGIDGLRHDATLHMNPAFVKGLKDAVDSDSTITHFGEFFIGRPDGKYAEYCKFPEATGVNNLDFEFFRAAGTTFGNFSTTMSNFGDMLLYTANDYEYENQAVTFLDNHDVTRFGYLQRNTKPYNAALAALLTSRGIPTIYYGTEQYIIPSDASDVAGRVFMQTAGGFDTSTTAYRLIGDLSELRQGNDALAYGMTTVLYSSDNVLVYQRKFYNNVVVVAVNRQPDISYTIPAISTDLPAGTYQDYTAGLLYGDPVSVTNNNGRKISSFVLEGGEVSIWQYDADSGTAPEIGDVVSTMGRAGNKVYIYGDGLGGSPAVTFGSTQAAVISAADNRIVTTVPYGAFAGDNLITVYQGSTPSNTFVYHVLSGDQNQMIFHVNASTNYGENIYIVGSIPELGSWNTDKCTEAMLCPNYPQWFLPVSVPAGTGFQFKFIKKDSSGNVVWESCPNRAITSASGSSATLDVYYTWNVN